MRLNMRTTVTTIAVLAVSATPTRARAQTGDNTVYACVNNMTNAVRIVAVGAAPAGWPAAVCLSSPAQRAETAVVWNITGPAGKDGLNGTNGADGANGANGTSVTITGSFTGNQHGCPNGGVILSDGLVTASLCNGTDGAAAGARADGPCFASYYDASGALHPSRYADCGNG